MPEAIFGREKHRFPISRVEDHLPYTLLIIIRQLGSSAINTFGYYDVNH
jgi:hypothetical protein